MNAFLGQDWAGFVIAAVIGVAGYLVWRLARGRSSKWLRGPLSGLGAFVVFVSGVLFIGAIVHIVEIVRVSAKYPMPGESFDVGGYRMHLMRKGENLVTAEGSAATVVLISGGYSQGLALHHLYEALAEDTHTIIFDRTGLGWSERSPEPRTFRNDVADLKRLLEAAGEPGPFILAGHSWGGLFAYQFAGRYPELTAGVVPLDATPFEFVRGKFAATLKPYGTILRIGAVARLFALDGILMRAIGLDYGKPGDEKFIFKPIAGIWDLYQAGDIHSRSGISASESFVDNVAEADDLVDEPGALGDIPMLVIYQENIMGDQSKLTPEEQEQAKNAGMKAFGMTSEEYDEFMRNAPQVAQQALDAVAALSRNSRVIHPPEGSTHQFPYEHPEWVADRIREMIDQTRGTASAAPVKTKAGAGSQQGSAVQQLRTLADDIWAWYLESSTYLRLQEDLPVERLEDLTLAQYHENQARTADYRTRLNAIDGTRLDDDDLITYEILAFELADTGANDDDYWLNFDITPYAGPYAYQFAQQALASQQLNDAAATDHYLLLVNEMADVTDQLIAQVEGQVERGIFLPKPALPPTRATWEGLKTALPAGIRVADDRLQALSPEERAAFNDALQQVIETRVITGFDRLLAAIGPDYEAQAPEAVGLGQYPHGDEVYRRRIRRETTLDLSSEEIHQRGVDAVADIIARMAAIREELGFSGTAQEFLDQLKADPRFIAQTPEAVEERYLELIHRIEPKLEAYFKRRPEAAYGVRRLPLASEAGMTYGYYNPPTKADPVGYYNYNASNLPTRSLAWAGSLIYHELLPGHHFHLAMQDENTALQPFRRKYSVAAFTEGWAEYAASLGIEMGVYETPQELYGRLVAEMFLATRLVVDTGMNALGWPLEDARAYMRERVIQSEAEIDSETLRYSTSIPAQALAYRLGYEKMWELRRAAEAALGENFDVRDFHDIVLSDGAKPLPVLAAKTQRWIARERRQ